jgi:hypothetical protein
MAGVDVRFRVRERPFVRGDRGVGPRPALRASETIVGRGRRVGAWDCAPMSYSRRGGRSGLGRREHYLRGWRRGFQDEGFGVGPGWGLAMAVSGCDFRGGRIGGWLGSAVAADGGEAGGPGIRVRRRRSDCWARYKGAGSLFGFGVCVLDPTMVSLVSASFKASSLSAKSPQCPIPALRSEAGSGERAGKAAIGQNPSVVPFGHFLHCEHSRTVLRRQCEAQMDSDKKWRIDNVKRLYGLRLQLRSYKAWSQEWDHDHCAACWVKFAEVEGPGSQTEGYATGSDYSRAAGYEWVCRQCFNDLQTDMGWAEVST